MGHDLRLLGAGELPQTDIPQARTINEAVLGCQKGIETQTGTIRAFEEQAIKSIGKLETPVINPTGASIDKTTSRRQKSKEGDSQPDAGNAMKFEVTTEEVNETLEQVFKTKAEINKAAGDLEGLATHSSALRKYQNVVKAGTSNVKTSFTDIYQNQKQNMPSSSELAREVDSWKPSYLCDDSILNYAEGEHWDGLKRNPVTGQMCRRVRPQEEGYFRAFSVLLGVRFVVVGSRLMKDL
jgi:hypothetical protein